MSARQTFPSRASLRCILPAKLRYSTFSSIPNIPSPLSYFALGTTLGKSYQTFSKHLSYRTPIWRLNDDNNPHPDPVITAHQRRRAHPLALAHHTRPEPFGVRVP
jgi:hypothetical protein